MDSNSEHRAILKLFFERAYKRKTAIGEYLRDKTMFLRIVAGKLAQKRGVHLHTKITYVEIIIFELKIKFFHLRTINPLEKVQKTE